MRSGIRLFRKRPVHIVVDDHHQSGLASEVQDPVQCRVGQARHRARDLAGYELLVDGEFADTAEYTRERLEHPANVVRAVHIGRIETRDHGIEPRPLLRRERKVGHRDPGIGERVVVQRGVRIQVVLRGAVSIHAVRPQLLQGNAEQRHPPGLVPHDLEEIPNVGAFLDVVGQVKMRVVEFEGARLLTRWPCHTRQKNREQCRAMYQSVSHHLSFNTGQSYRRRRPCR